MLPLSVGIRDSAVQLVLTPLRGIGKGLLTRHRVHGVRTRVRGRGYRVDAEPRQPAQQVVRGGRCDPSGPRSVSIRVSKETQYGSLKLNRVS